MSAKITFGTNNAFAFKTWPEPEMWTKIIAQELGLKEVQFSFDLLDPLIGEPGCTLLCAKVLKAVQEYKLSMRTSFTGLIMYAQNLLSHPDAVLRAHGFRWYQGAVELAGKLGVEATGGHVGAMSARDYADPQRRSFIRSSLVEMIRDLTWLAARHGQKYFLWEAMPTPREIPHTPEEAIELLQEVNEGAAVPVYICFDLGHCNSFDFDTPGDPHAWLEKLLPYVPVVHLQQTDGLADHHWPFTPEYNKVGIINPKRVMETVKSSPFPEVMLLFELGHAFDAPDQQVIDDHKHSVDTWSKWI
jgi:sugar phosphate isomerase/epimerase